MTKSGQAVVEKRWIGREKAANWTPASCDCSRLPSLKKSLSKRAAAEHSTWYHHEKKGKIIEGRHLMPLRREVLHTETPQDDAYVSSAKPQKSHGLLEHFFCWRHGIDRRKEFRPIKVGSNSSPDGTQRTWRCHCHGGDGRLTPGWRRPSVWPCSGGGPTPEGSVAMYILIWKII